jgi:hypothetical protein
MVDPGASRQFVLSPSLALAGREATASAVWVAEDLSGPAEAAKLETSDRRPDGGYAPPLDLPTPPDIAEPPVAVATEAAGVVVRQTGVYGNYRLHYAVRTESEALSLAPSLGAGPVVTPPALAAAANAVVATWVSVRANKETRLEVAILRD